MKNFSILLIFNLLLVLFQVSFLTEFVSSKYMPNLILSFSYSFILMNLIDEALCSALIGGIIFDMFGFGTIGVSSFAVCTVDFAAYYIRKLFFGSKIIQSLFIFPSFIIVYITQNLEKSLVFDLTLVLGFVSTYIFCWFFYYINTKVLKFSSNAELYLNEKI